jgi:hypothetical protein
MYILKAGNAYWFCVSGFYLNFGDLLLGTMGGGAGCHLYV